MPIHPDLTKFVQTLQVLDGSQPTYEGKTYPGVSPILVRRNESPTIVTQTGSATAWGRVFVPPAPMFAVLVEPASIERVRVSFREWRTTWRYIMALSGGETIADLAAAQIAAAQWPTDATFTEVPS